MKTQTNYMGMTLTDIIFDNRNKAYGAYELRQTYNTTILKAMATTVLFASLLFILPKLYAHFFPEVVKGITQIEIAPTDVTKLIKDVFETRKVDPPKPSGSSDKPTAKFGTMASVEDKSTPQDSIATLEDLRTADVGDKFNKGSGEKDGTAGSGEGKEQVTEKAVTNTTEIYNGATVEVMPEFPGGEAALMEFLQKNVVYPERERDLGIEGQVTMGFIIDERGKVIEAKPLKGARAGFNVESTRVVNLLPDFKPGMQAGRPVKVRYVLPIKYQLN
jgi:protein TonB